MYCRLKNPVCLYILTIGISFLACKKPLINPTLTGYTERRHCISCHEEIYLSYKGSHHDLAIEVAGDSSVLGNFDTTITHLGDAARFYRKEGDFYVYTKGENGVYKDFKVSYTFGWTPLQQYLIEFPRGAYQVLPFCWDSRTDEEGGQRWFHIYDQEKIPHDDILFWTGKQQNWNHVCAECHSTDLHKNFNTDSLTFNTTWKEIDVSCDACHGPSANHLKWAELNEKGKSTKRYPNMGYAFRFHNDSAKWIFKDASGTAVRSKTRTNHQLIELCARCHSRRMQIWDEYIHGEELLQTHIPEVLEPRLYHYDGQIMDEVYVYGSFIQSKMYKGGVECIDCHDAHSYEIKAPGNIICATCHVNDMYNTPEHHFHENEEKGGSCRDCHMPMQKYMVVDPRYDHSFRIPRPDLSLKIGVPNACNNCHDDESVEWANEWFKKWYGNKYDTTGHFGIAFHAAHNQKDNAFEQIQKVIHDTAITDIVRATAVFYLQLIPSGQAAELTRKLCFDHSPIVRLNALRTLSVLEGNNAVSTAVKLINDPVRTVRYEAIQISGRVPSNQLTARQRQSITHEKIDEYIKMLNTNNDQAASHVNRGIYYVNQGKSDSAILSYNLAIAVDSSSIEAMINLADVYRLQNKDHIGEEILLKAAKQHSSRPEVYNALGMLYTRQKNTSRALEMFRKSYDLMPDNSYYIYIYAIALNSIGKSNEAIKILEKGYSSDPYNQNILIGLATINRDIGNKEKYLFYISRLNNLTGQGSR